jgi:hypothetical protein
MAASQPPTECVGCVLRDRTDFGRSLWEKLDRAVQDGTLDHGTAEAVFGIAAREFHKSFTELNKRTRRSGIKSNWVALDRLETEFSRRCHGAATKLALPTQLPCEPVLELKGPCKLSARDHTLKGSVFVSQFQALGRSRTGVAREVGGALKGSSVEVMHTD